MFHKVKSVTPLQGNKLSVQFSEGVAKEYDASKLDLIWPSFKTVLCEYDSFSKVEVDTGGYGIVWNDQVDLSCNELWDNGTVIETPFDGLMAFGDATELWGLNESTLRKAVSYGKLIVGRDVCKYGKQWVITRDAMFREYGEPKVA